MNAPLTRRRFLTISAATLGLATTAHAAPPVAHWRGTALGAGASMQLSGVSGDAARKVFNGVEAELNRLEDIFSLYRPGSALSRLNRDGFLTLPPPELLEVFSLCTTIHTGTAGAFDPTVQPLWTLFANHAGHMPSRHELDEALALVGWGKVSISSARVAFARPGMAVTLNGIAQGYVTDRVADLLRGQGLRDVLVDMGEIVASGHPAHGAGWTAGIAAPDGRVVQRTVLRDRALATSAPLGTRIGGTDAVGHILDPRHGTPAQARPLVSVSADRAALADALSTAFCLMPDGSIATALQHHRTARAELLQPLQTLTRI